MIGVYRIYWNYTCAECGCNAFAETKYWKCRKCGAGIEIEDFKTTEEQEQEWVKEAAVTGEALPEYVVRRMNENK